MTRSAFIFRGGRARWRGAAAWGLVVVALCALVGCVSARPSVERLEGELRAVDARFEPREPGVARQVVDFDGDLGRYVDAALSQSPAIQARYAAWESATRRVGAADKLPEPVLNYEFFVRRGGSQEHRFGLMQMLPWYDKLDQSVRASAAEARAVGLEFEAEVIHLHREVSDVYWELWQVRQSSAIKGEQIELLLLLAETLRGRLEVGQASVADVAQVEMSVAHLSYRVRELEEADGELSAHLAALVGAPIGTPTPTTEGVVDPVRPTEAVEALRQSARQHPEAESLARRAEGSRALVARARASRYPDLTVGVEVEAEVMEGSDDGKEAIMAVLGLTLPVWSGAYEAEEAAERAGERAWAHQREAVQDDKESQVVQALARLRDTGRHVRLYRETLIPQAEAAYGSAMGAYETGQGSVAAILMVFERLQELREESIEAQASHMMAWAWLESAAGRPLSLEVVP